jgi:FAD:protein FMN transferase
VTKVARFRAMGCDVLVGGASPAERRAVENLFAERDRHFSRFRADSELNRVNANAGAAIEVSDDFAQMLALALAAAEQTGGLVDPTLGAAIEAAGYDDDFAQLVDDRAAPERSERGGRGCWRSIRLLGRLLRVPRGVQLDLNGVVKGQTVDDALGLIDGEGFVSAGGDLAARGGLVVSLPRGGTVQLVEGALATSGKDRRHWLRGGRLQHHLIDPRTGEPAISPWETVTVCGETCVGADVGAKAAFVLGVDAPDRLDELDLPARFVRASGEVVANPAWRRSVPQEAAACT